MGNTDSSSGNPPKLGDVFMDFQVETSQGTIKWHEFIDGKWGILFSHPADYTPVCTTELGTAAKYFGEFQKRNCVIAGLSCNGVESHKGWIKDIIASQGLEGEDLPYPIIADPDRKLALALGMLDPDEIASDGLPLSARAVFIINPQKKLALSLLYPATTGRNFDELLRVLDSLQLTAVKKVATPANWTRGQNCMVIPSLSDDQAKELLPKGFTKVDVPSGKGYIRLTPDPSDA